MKILTAVLAALLSLSACTAQNTKTEKMSKKKVLVAFYSATGTTKGKAEAMAKAVGATLYEIIPAQPYSDADLNWRNKQSRSSVEMTNEKSRPALGGEKVNAADYDVVMVGYPIWWNLCPRVVNTWIESQNLEGKTVVPFATSGGSTIAKSVANLKQLYPQIHWQDGKLLYGSDADAAAWAKTVTK